MEEGAAMNGIRLAAAVLGTAVCGAVYAAPAAMQTRVEVMSGNDMVASILVPTRARVHTKAERMSAVNDNGATVLRMEGQAQVEVRDGDKLLFTLKAEQLVVREARPGIASGAPARSRTPGATFILG
jgi:hypothetical protein